MKSKFFLPAPDEMLRKSKSLAMLDAIYCQQWDLRYFSHHSKWGDAEEMGSMRDGEGNDYFILFSPAGTAMKGCFLDAGTQGVDLINEIHSSMPARFSDFMHEPAFSMDESSFVAWFDDAHHTWIKIGASHNLETADDGSAWLTQWIRKGAGFYREWAAHYYEEPIDLGLVEHVFSFQPLDIVSIRRLGLKLDEHQLFEDIDEIGYPTV